MKHLCCSMILVILCLSHTFSRQVDAFPAPQSSPLFPLCLSAEERQLAQLVQDYRRMHGLVPTSITYSLTQVAKVHVRDLHAHFLVPVPRRAGMGCNLHSWSAMGHWTPVCYRPDHGLATAMWNKPREITANVYTGNGYEIAYWSSIPVSVHRILAGWQRSPSHRAVLLETGAWQQKRWPAMGVGIHGQFAVVWFGDRPDPQGSVFPCQAPATPVVLGQSPTAATARYVR